MSDATTHLQAAQSAREAGALYDAALHQRRAVALLRGEDSALLGPALRQLVEILIEADTPAEADGLVAEMLALQHGVDESRTSERAAALRCAALHARASGDDETASAFWREARAAYQALGDGAALTEIDSRLDDLRD